MPKLPLLALVATLSVASTGCFAELNTGMYSASHSGGAAPNADIKGSAWNLGINVGAAWDIDRKVRVGAALGYQALNFHGKDDGKGSAAGIDIGLLADYTVVKLGDDGAVRASLRAQFGTGPRKITYTPANGGEIGEDASGLLDVHGGASLTLFAKDQDEFYVMGGPRYIKMSADNFGSITAVGLGLILGVQWTPGGSERPSSGGDGPLVYRSVLDDNTNVIPALAVGASASGCDVTVDGQTFVATCPEGKIGAQQDGRTVVRICQAGMSESSCQGVWSRVLNAAAGR